MIFPTSPCRRLALSLLAAAMVVGGCSSSDPSRSPSETGVIAADPPSPGPAVPDPLARTTVTVNVDITVPAHVSDALQVRLTWGDLDVMAEWIGDELWSVSREFPADTERLLTVTFLDDDGAVVLGSVEQRFRTGTNDLELLAIGADRFDTGRWDSDGGHGASNLDESIAGTDVFASPKVLPSSTVREADLSRRTDVVRLSGDSTADRCSGTFRKNHATFNLA